MRFFGVTDKVKQTLFDVRWYPGQENLADYFTKHFDAKHHREVRPWYLHEANSPRVFAESISINYSERVRWNSPQWIHQVGSFA